MTEEQFAKMHAVELSKLAMLQGIYYCLQNIAMKQGADAGGYNWKDLDRLLAQATAQAAKQPAK